MKSAFLKILTQCCFAVALMFTLSPRSEAGPIVIIGGGGVSEYSVVFASQNLPSLFEECKTLVCAFTPEQYNTFEPYLKASHHIPTLSFQTRKELGDRRFAINGNAVQVNADLLWRDGDISKPFNIGDSLALWISILSEYHRLQLNDGVLTQVKGAFSTEIQRNEVKLDTTNTVELLLWKGHTVDRFYVRDSRLQTVFLTPFIEKALFCGEISATIHLFTPAWSSTREPEFNLGFGINWSCGDRSGHTSGVVMIRGLRDGQGALSFDPTSVFVQIEMQGAQL